MDQLQNPFCIDLYTGKWYEVARIPNAYEKSCAYATATYKKENNTTLSVFNECYDKKGNVVRSIEGVAKVVYPQYPAALLVLFPVDYESDSESYQGCEGGTVGTGTTGGTGATGLGGVNYLVHKTDFTTFAIVGTPDKQSLWFLTRYDKINLKLYQNLLKYADMLGYDYKKVKPNEGMIVSCENLENGNGKNGNGKNGNGKNGNYKCRDCKPYVRK